MPRTIGGRKTNKVLCVRRGGKTHALGHADRGRCGCSPPAPPVACRAPVGDARHHDVMNAVVVTGSASGLGHVIASRLAAQGHDLVLVDKAEAGLLRASDELRTRHGVAVETIVGDLSTSSGIESVTEELQRLGDVTGLINNAGGWSPGEQYPGAAQDVWMSAMTLNLLAPMLLTQRLWGTLASCSGSVINIGSSGGLGDDAYGSPEYGAAKAGLHRFTTSLGGRDDVRVMAIVPGWIGLERARAEFAQLSAADQLGRGPLIPPSDVADTVVRLLDQGAAGEVVELLG
jgi:short-subunit dehydrogenase